MHTNENDEGLLAQECGSAGAGSDRGAEGPDARGKSGVEAADDKANGLARYRNAALVGAGGLACAAVGAFMGGLGGYFTVAPAAAHAVSSTAEGTSLAAAVDHAAGVSGGGSDGGFGSGSSASGFATLADLAGSLTQGLAPFSTGSSPVTTTFAVLGETPSSDAGGRASGPAAGGSGADGTGDSGLGCLAGGADLSALINSVACTLGSTGSLPGNGSTGLPSSLSGLGSDVTGTLADLTSLLSATSLPGGLPVSPPTLSGLPAPGGAVGSGGSGGLGGSGPTSGAASAVLSTVTAAANGLGGGAGSTALPLPASGGSASSSGGGATSTPTLPSLPVTTPSTPTVTSRGGSTTVAAPLPAAPVSVGTTVTVGGISVGISTGGASPGATLTLP